MNKIILHNAILQDDHATLRLLREDKTLKNERDDWGYQPVEIARFFNKIKSLRVLREWNPQKIRYFSEDENKFFEFEDFDIENILAFKPISANYFEDYNFFIKLLGDYSLIYRYTPMGVSLSDQSPADVYVKWVDDVFGYGLFAGADLKKNDYIGEYYGHIREIDPKDPVLNGYCVQYLTGLFSKRYVVIDAKDYGNALRFVNHSDTPNVEARWAYDRGLLHLLFFAKEDIAADGQLFINYGTDYWQHREKWTRGRTQRT